MNRGLGKLQREILDRMRASGGGDAIDEGRAGGRSMITLAAGWHDMRRLASEMARNQHGLVEGARQAAFSRAIDTLFNRGILVTQVLIPVAGYWDWEDRISAKWMARLQHLSDGTYLMVPSGPRWHHRFARLS